MLQPNSKTLLGTVDLASPNIASAFSLAGAGVPGTASEVLIYAHVGTGNAGADISTASWRCTPLMEHTNTRSTCPSSLTPRRPGRTTW